jgi:hypothetical protein
MRPQKCPSHGNLMASERGTACLRVAGRLIYNRFIVLMLRGLTSASAQMFCRWTLRPYGNQRLRCHTILTIHVAVYQWHPRIKRILPSDDNQNQTAPVWFKMSWVELGRIELPSCQHIIDTLLELATSRDSNSTMPPSRQPCYPLHHDILTGANCHVCLLTIHS